MATVDKSRIKKDDKGREYIVVIYGDTLSDIALAYFGENYQAPTSWEQIASLNKLADPNYITPGQTIYLSNGSNSTPPPTSYKDNGNALPTVTLFGVLAGGNQPNRIYAVWTWPRRADTETFEVEWRAYKMGFWTERKDENVDVDRQHSYYDIPDDTLISKIEFRVRPVPKTDKKKMSDGKEVSTTRFDTARWTDWHDHVYYVTHKPDAPGQVTVELNGLELTASVTNPGKDKASIIKFQLIPDNNLNTATIAKAAVDDSSTIVAHTFKVEAGHSYTVRACANLNNEDSEWSSLSQSVETRPANVEISKVEPRSKDSIYIEWSSSATADGYTLEYTDDKDGFYEGVQKTTQNLTSKDSTNFTATNLSSGLTYSFRVKAKRGSEESEWSEVKTAVIGTTPTSPTTWSSTTTAIAGEGESVALYWVHNSTDGSSQTSAEVKMVMEGVDNLSSVAYNVSVEKGKLDKTVVDDDNKTVTYLITAATSDTETNPTHSLIIDTKNYGDGAKITWNVITTSSTGMASEPSADRVVEVFSRPTIFMTVSNGTSSDIGATYYKVEYLSATDTYSRTNEILSPLEGAPISGTFTVEGNHQVRSATVDGETVYYCVVEEDSLTSLPLKVRVEVDTNAVIQYPIEYLVTILATEQYDTVDNFGDQVTVSTGQTLFSRHYTASGMEPLSVNISAGDVSLENGQDYTIKCLVAMSSGLTVEAFTEVHISWSATSYYLAAQIGYDDSNYSVFLKPYCEGSRRVYYKVDKIGSLYYLGTDAYDYIYGSALPNVVTTRGEQVYQGTLSDGTSVYYAIVDEQTPVTDVLMSVYRREYDGGFTAIIEDLDASKNAFVTDPHPSLDYARYRIVAKDKRTSAVTYSDITNYPIGEKAIIIQWGEPMTSFETPEYSLSSGTNKESFLRLPYNIDVTNTRDPDVSLVEYIGRKHPVTYYGTQVGEAANWSTTIPKYDIETIYALQRLQAYSGDVYVREPNGTGYWANVKVSFSKNHLETTVPISIDVIRVEGGA